MILAFESSCDETCCAVLDGAKVLSNIVSSQVDIHKLYGGVVPEIASRNHAMAIKNVCDLALSTAGVKLYEITEICASAHVGLRGAVMIGHIFGESLGVALKIPFTPINHLAGHIASVAIGNDGKIEMPFLSLLVSGGHTSLYLVRAWDDIKMIATTIDDSVGECFDKVGRLLGVEYPAGAKIERLARDWSGELITFVKNPQTKDFSYSGLKTAVRNYLLKNPDYNLLQICASFLAEAVGQLVNKTVDCARKVGVKNISVCGGVSANGYLRAEMEKAVASIGGRVLFPKMEYCTDNAGMIAMACALGVKI